MTLGLFWIFYKYREPIYCNERMQLNFMSDDDVNDYLYTQLEKRMFQLGVMDYFVRPFTVPEKHPNYLCVKKVFDKLIKAGEIEVMELELYLMRNKSKLPSQLTLTQLPNLKTVFLENEMKIHPHAILVNHEELKVTKTYGGLAAMLAPRIARKALNHQSELLNHFVFACFATVPAILFSAVALRSKAARAFAVPYFWYYGALIAFQNTMLLSRQLNEADYVGLVIMERAGYDISEAVEYRKRQVKLGEAKLETFEKLSEKTQFNPLRMSDIVKEKLGLMPLQKWTAIVSLFP
jgi:hypothetical protein